MRRQPFGLDQELGMGQIFRLCCHVPAPRSASGDVARNELIKSEKSCQRHVAINRRLIQGPLRFVPLGSAFAELHGVLDPDDRYE
jgi:hypothetical protein